jgi:hypothetical protein
MLQIKIEILPAEKARKDNPCLFDMCAQHGSGKGNGTTFTGIIFFRGMRK